MFYLKLESHEIRPEYQAGIPARLIESLVNYAEHRLMPGHFLQAVLANDLFAAIGRGDPDAIGSLPILTEFIFNELPGEAWGSREKIAAWCAERIKHDLNLHSEFTNEEMQREHHARRAQAHDAISEHRKKYGSCSCQMGHPPCPYCTNMPEICYEEGILR